jgi:hypothetical protein
MTIHIYPKTTVGDIQQQFSIAYPFLRILFCDQPHREGEEVVNAHWYKPKLQLAEKAKNALNNELSIHPWHRTAEVEMAFVNCLGLPVQIFRKEGDRWIQTAGSDELTLEEQNTIGREREEAQHGSIWTENEREP